MNAAKRSKEFSRNNRLECALKELEQLLGPGKLIAEKGLTAPDLPTLFVIGAPRSGTTLSMQVLASCGAFAYPSNLLSRFYSAPYIGSLIQRITIDPDYDYKDEMSGGLGGCQAFSSEVGKTKGAVQPSEFWCF